MIYIFIGIYLLLGILPGIKLANKNYDNWEKTFTPSAYTYRYKWVSKSLHSIIYGLSFIIALTLWPLSLIELIGDKKK